MIDFLVLGLEYLALSVLCFYILFTFKKRRLLSPLTLPITVMGLLFLFQAVIDFGFLFGTLPAVPGELALVHTAVVVVLALILGFIISRLTGHPDITFLIGLYAVAVVLAVAAFAEPFRNLQVMSYFFMAILFLHLELIQQKDIKESGQLGMLFAGPAALLSMWGLMERGWFAVVMLLPLGAFLFKLYFGLLKGHATVVKEPLTRPSLVRLARLIGFTIAFYLFIGLAVVGLHEMGHVAVASYYKCEYSRAVIYDVGEMPHAELSCSQGYNDTLLTLGGVLATSALAFALLLMPGNHFVFSLSFFVLGFGLLISFSDFTHLGTGKGFLALLHLVGLTFIVLSVVELVVMFRLDSVRQKFSLLWESEENESFK